MNSLTSETLAILKAPFAPNEHEFLKGMAYITEYAITNRIEQVDPAWSLEQVSLYNRVDSGSNLPIVVCTMRLTICGVSRDGIGMADVTLTKQGNSEANEAEKSAATDAMKRAARLFGIGRYLLNLPDNVRDSVSMAQYLNRGQKPASSVGNSTPATPAPQAAQKPAETPQKVFGDWIHKPVKEAWKDLHPYLLEHIYKGNKTGKEKSMQHHANKTNGWKDMTALDVINYLEHRHDDELPEAANQ